MHADVNSSVNSYSEDVLSRKSDIDIIHESSKDISEPVLSPSLTLPRPSAPSIKLFTPKMFEVEAKTVSSSTFRVREVNSSYEVTPYQVRQS